MSGDTVVIGAPRETVGANDSQGAAYVLVRSGTTWTFQQRLFASDGTAGNQFARRVAIDGETIIINSDEFGTGSAYVFVRNGTTWTQQQKLVASDGAQLDRFGTGVDISGNTVIVGAAQDDINTNDNQGSAYVFTRSGSVWSEQEKLIASDGAQFDQFGSSVSVSGDYAVVGDAADTVGGVAAQGSVYVFVRSGSDWTEQTKLIDSEGHDSDNFGTSVDLEGDTLAIGSFRGDVGTAVFNQGTVSVFVRHGTSWNQQARLFSADGAQGDEFGISLSLSGDDLIVGADFNNVHGTPFPGAAYLFTRSGTAWTQRSKLIPAGNSDRFGQSVALGGQQNFCGRSGRRYRYSGKAGSGLLFSQTYRRARSTASQRQRIK
ncbi:MAG TPA: FG-GAP repeat protein [Pyrinomonadaceae bacterium]|jgi:hypothetical protein|nr:FG-GAP repeat protein [Pyrinomonadaceae bacterium]